VREAQEPFATATVGFIDIGEACFFGTLQIVEIRREIVGTTILGSVEPGGGGVTILVVVIVFEGYFEAIEVGFDTSILGLVSLTAHGKEKARI
jgi:hypothetical protein